MLYLENPQRTRDNIDENDYQLHCKASITLLSLIAIHIGVSFNAACAVESPGSSFVTIAKDTVVGTCKDALGVIVAPLEDLNIKRQEIPQELENCSLNPYAMPLPPLCMNINAEC